MQGWVLRAWCEQSIVQIEREKAEEARMNALRARRVLCFIPKPTYCSTHHTLSPQ